MSSDSKSPTPYSTAQSVTAAEQPDTRSAFERLHPTLQYHIVNGLRWSGLRPVQELASLAILDGNDAVVLAPTAGGKTEAAFFPLLSQALQERWTGLNILYVSPIRALLNNQFERVQVLCTALGLTAGLWHGDVTASARKKIRQNPPTVLLTTPESLEAILISRTGRRHPFFNDLRAVIVDEVHAFAGSDRGWHLQGVLGRLQQLTPHALQRIGLSATVGNRQEIVTWLAANSARPRCTVDPPRGSAAEPTVLIDYVGSLPNAAKVIARLHVDEKRLVFCDSRAQAEELTRLLRGAGVTTHVTHGSLSRTERATTEAAFAHGGAGVIVATSALELGIDIGDLDRVIQVDAPYSVASFLQRMGRTGRRAHSITNCLFLAISETTLVRAAAIVDAWSRGVVEPAQADFEPWHVAAQQMMASVLQNPGVSRDQVFDSLRPWAGLARLPDKEQSELLEHLIAKEWIFEDEGLLSMGQGGEQSLGKRHFRALMSVFSTPPLFSVMNGTREIGQVGLNTFDPDVTRPQAVLLAGRAWLVQRFDWRKNIAWVEPMEGQGRVKFDGDAVPMSEILAQAHRRVLRGEAGAKHTWSRRAQTAMESTELAHAWLQEADGDPVFTDEGDAVTIWTFAGGRKNRRFAAALCQRGALQAIPSGIRIKVKANDLSIQHVQAMWESIQNQMPPLLFDPDAPEKAGLKFEKLLPPDLAFRAMVARKYEE
jgi:ATP-dependent Lhr-like helicase